MGAPVPRVVRFAPRVLDRLEAGFVRQAMRIQGVRLNLLEPIVRQVLAAGHVPDDLRVPGEHHYTELWGRYAAELYLAGAGHAAAEVETKRRQRRGHFQQFNITLPPGVAWERVVPREALEFIKRRQVLQGKWNRDLDAKVSAILHLAVEQGATVEQTMRALSRLFPKFSRPRLETIARTEGTTIYNQGRLDVFQANSDFVVAVQFLAILDERTTTICRGRNGLIMRLDDARLKANMPPLHFRCRSVVSPIDRYDWEDLKRGDRRAERDIFGHLEDGPNGEPPPRNLSEATKGWKDVEQPQSGFGSVAGAGGSGTRPPKPPPPAPPSPDGEDEPFHEFSTHAERDRWYNEQNQQWRDQLTPEERDAVLRYKEDGWPEINGYLRDPNPTSKADRELERVIRRIDDAVQRGQVPNNMVFYRGIKDYGEVYTVGKVLVEKAYLSLTVDKELAGDMAGTLDPGYVFRFQVPKGTAAAYPDGLGVSEGELEVLLGRGTLYRVTQVQPPLHKGGHTVVTVELI